MEDMALGTSGTQQSTARPPTIPPCNSHSHTFWLKTPAALGDVWSPKLDLQMGGRDIINGGGISTEKGLKLTPMLTFGDIDEIWT